MKRLKQYSIKQYLTYKGILMAVIAAIVVVAVVWLLRTISEGNIHLGHSDKISPSPTQILSIQQIGQWEFLNITGEELQDTVRHGFFGDDQLVCIYYGTIRLGIDMADADSKWIQNEGDTVVINLPPIRLLNEHFLDETRTRTFIETGKWDAKAYRRLAVKAEQAMKERCMTAENIAEAKQQARQQFSQMFRSMGFTHVRVGFNKKKPLG